MIPVLLLKSGGLYKTEKFKNPTYVGDPINAVRIFNEKEVDELVVLDIDATVEARAPNLQLIDEIASECFMPLCYGGGIRSVEQAKALFRAGVEKLSVNSYALENPSLIENLASQYGSQSIVGSIDVKKSLFGGYQVFSRSGTYKTKLNPVDAARMLVDSGVGELMVNSIDRDGTRQGYDLDLLGQITSTVDVPVIACGGASGMKDMVTAVKEAGTSAVAAGSLFVFHGRHKAVLINVPSQEDFKNALASHL